MASFYKSRLQYSFSNVQVWKKKLRPTDQDCSGQFWAWSDRHWMIDTYVTTRNLVKDEFVHELQSLTVIAVCSLVQTITVLLLRRCPLMTSKLLDIFTFGFTNLTCKKNDNIEFDKFIYRRMLQIISTLSFKAQFRKFTNLASLYNNSWQGTSSSSANKFFEVDSQCYHMKILSGIVCDEIPHTFLTVAFVKLFMIHLPSRFPLKTSFKARNENLEHWSLLVSSFHSILDNWSVFF